ncbi:hypothetical protein C8R45DRAFT_361986 [Mycena sanguinolenta]|nr:hypothetical protein C8R45DRAFT_361986 [Mycena sanguinolenta]
MNSKNMLLFRFLLVNVVFSNYLLCSSTQTPNRSSLQSASLKLLKHEVVFVLKSEGFHILGPNGLNIAGPGGLLDGLLGIDLEVCLCIDNLDIYLKANANVTTNGQALAPINALIDAADDTNARCSPLPAHATRKCTTSNPCVSDCTAPYTLSSDGTQCVCIVVLPLV